MQAIGTANGGYSAAALTATLLGGALALSPRFEVLDRNFVPLGNLTTVTGAQVNWNVDRAVKGALSLAMMADSSGLLPFSTVPFSRYVKPYFRALMPDGGYAEWPQGVYFWSKPQRTIVGSGLEKWTVTLGDRGWQLLAGGPGVGGFTIASGQKTTDAMVQTLQTALGSTVDTSRVAAATSAVVSTLTWDLTQNATQHQKTAQTGGDTGDANGGSGKPGTSWQDILAALAQSIGYYTCWFDLVGRPVLMPMPNLAASAAAFTYSSGANSILLPPAVDNEQLDSFANRAVVRSQNASINAPTIVAVADLNTLIPTHPMNQASIGFYIDAVIDDTVAGSFTDLAARATAELFTRAAMYQTIDITTQAWPVHEAFDLIGVQWTGDTDFDTAKVLHEREWTLDLFSGVATRTLRRIVP